MRRRRQQEERRMKMIMTAAAVICVLLLVVGVGILLRRRMPEVVHMTEDTGKTAVVVKKKEKEKTSEKQTENQTEDQKKEQSGTKTESQSTAQKKEGTETQINPENIQNRRRRFRNKMLRLRVIKIQEPFRYSSRKITHLRVRRRKPLQLPIVHPNIPPRRIWGLR